MSLRDPRVPGGSVTQRVYPKLIDAYGNAETRFVILNDKGDDAIGGCILSTGNAGIVPATDGSAGTPFNMSSFTNSPTRARIILHQPHTVISPIEFVMVAVNAGSVAAAAAIFAYNEGTDDGIAAGQSRGVTFDSDAGFSIISTNRPQIDFDYGTTVITDIYCLPLWSEGTPAGTAELTGEF